MTTSTSSHAEQRRHELVDQLAAAGYLSDARWLDAFRSVAREAFVTAFAVPTRDGGVHRHDLADPADVEDALCAVYTDSSLLTQFDAGGTATSSSTAPSLMALMLHQLDIHSGQRVLEIGTGTGYNAALLAHVLGCASVFTVDVDPQLVATAREALDAEGFRVSVDVADGRGGYPQCAPYDRIIATCGLDRVPAAWLRQVSPGGSILVNLSFALVLLTVDEDGTASGRFGETAAFMSMRATPTDVAPTAADALAETAQTGDHPVRQTAWHDELAAEPVAFLRALAMPTVQVLTCHMSDGPELLLTDPASGSWARARRTADGARLVEHGPRRLYDELADLAIEWDQHGRPPPDRYGLTVSATGHHTLWLDQPSTLIASL